MRAIALSSTWLVLAGCPYISGPLTEKQIEAYTSSSLGVVDATPCASATTLQVALHEDWAGLELQLAVSLEGELAISTLATADDNARISLEIPIQSLECESCAVSVELSNAQHVWTNEAVFQRRELEVELGAVVGGSWVPVTGNEVPAGAASLGFLTPGLEDSTLTFACTNGGCDAVVAAPSEINGTPGGALAQVVPIAELETACEETGYTLYVSAVGCESQSVELPYTLLAPECDLDGDGDQFVDSEDCDDDDPTVFPGAEELCDGRANDCDEPELSEEEQDADGDGILACIPSPTSGLFGGDCDDTNPLVNPEASEVCDGLDNNCDGTTGPEELDTDGDGYVSCTNWVGDASLLPGDCEDGFGSAYPGATEVCDGVDSNCDGDVPLEEQDFDNDGFLACIEPEGGASGYDCNDNNALINPAVLDTCNGLDDDCSHYNWATGVAGLDPVEVDADFDGYVECEVLEDSWVGDSAVIGGGDCDPLHVAAHPGQTEEACDGLPDTDCNPLTVLDEADQDGDLVVVCERSHEDPWYGSAQRPSGGDCDDTNDAIQPGIEETCGPEDVNCIPGDEPAGRMLYHDGDGDGYGTGVGEESCAIIAGKASKDGDCDDANANISPGAFEICDGVDDDCDGSLEFVMAASVGNTLTRKDGDLREAIQHWEVVEYCPAPNQTISAPLLMTTARHVRSIGGPIQVVVSKLDEPAITIEGVGEVTLEDLTVTGTNGAPGILSHTPDPVVVVASLIEGNSNPTGAGGGISAAGEVVLVDTVVEANEAASGGGIAAVGALSLEGVSRLEANIALAAGGGAQILADADGHAHLASDGAVVAENSAETGGGVSLLGTTVSCDVISSTIEDNVAITTGGGLQVEGAGDCSLTDSTLQNNLAATGTEVYAYDASITSTNTSFLGAPAASTLWLSPLATATLDLSTTSFTGQVSSDLDSMLLSGSVEYTCDGSSLPVCQTN